MTSKILFIDIETKPATAYVWGLFDQNIGLNQLIESGDILCFGAKWDHEQGFEFYSEWEHGYDEMIRQAHRLLSDADAVVTYNGDKFDLPKLKGAMLRLRLPPPPPITSIDLYKTVRSNLGLQSNKLAYVGPFLKLGRKMKNEGFELWAKVMEGDERAQRKMKRYCIQDVRLTRSVYKLMRPYIFNHPHLGETGGAACGACGSKHIQSRGYRRTKSFRIQRMHCQTCGSWQDGKREKVT